MTPRDHGASARDDSSTPETATPARWWHALADGRIQCDLCPRDCKLHEGQRGLCFVRQREGEQMVLTTYGRSSGFRIDPIEKKPLNHFLPGSSVLSFGTAGCTWPASSARTGVHTYRFAVFASRDKLQVDTRKPWTIDAFEAKHGSQVLAKAQITGKF